MRVRTPQVVVYRRTAMWRIPAVERVCARCQGVFVVPRGSVSHGRTYCGQVCANVTSSQRRTPEQRHALSTKAGRKHGAQARARAAVPLVMTQLQDVEREVRLDRDGRVAVKDALVAVHQAAYRLGYAGGLRHQRQQAIDTAA